MLCWDETTAISFLLRFCGKGTSRAWIKLFPWIGFSRAYALFPPTLTAKHDLSAFSVSCAFLSISLPFTAFFFSSCVSVEIFLAATPAPLVDLCPSPLPTSPFLPTALDSDGISSGARRQSD